MAQEHADLAVLDASGRAAVLALHACRVQPLLDEPGLIDDQHRSVVAQLLDDVLAQHVARGVRIPLRALQQVLHAVRRGLAQPLGQLPAVLARHFAQAPLQVLQAALPGFGSPEQPRQPLMHVHQRPFPDLHPRAHRSRPPCTSSQKLLV
jgi:hypothetical protein